MDINEQSKEDLQTPLNLAAQLGNTNFATQLLEHGADPSICDKNHKLPIHYAVSFGDVDLILQLLDHGSPLTYLDFSPSPLSEALSHQYYKISSLLISNGALPNSATKAIIATNSPDILKLFMAVGIQMSPKIIKSLPRPMGRVADQWTPADVPLNAENGSPSLKGKIIKTQQNRDILEQIMKKAEKVTEYGRQFMRKIVTDSSYSRSFTMFLNDINGVAASIGKISIDYVTTAKELCGFRNELISEQYSLLNHLTSNQEEISLSKEETESIQKILLENRSILLQLNHQTDQLNKDVIALFNFSEELKIASLNQLDSFSNLFERLIQAIIQQQQLNMDFESIRSDLCFSQDVNLAVEDKKFQLEKDKAYIILEKQNVVKLFHNAQRLLKVCVK